MVTETAYIEAKARLLREIRKVARSAADLQAQANNYDRPIAETPWLADHRYGDGEYDARWYAVYGALDGFNERVATSLDEALDIFAAAVLAAGPKEAT